jgi:hypothetical protein
VEKAEEFYFECCYSVMLFLVPDVVLDCVSYGPYPFQGITGSIHILKITR